MKNYHILQSLYQENVLRISHRRCRKVTHSRASFCLLDSSPDEAGRADKNGPRGDMLVVPSVIAVHAACLF